MEQARCNIIVFVEVSNAQLKTEVTNGINHWKRAIDEYAVERNRMNLQSLLFDMWSPMIPDSCVPIPGPGQAQRLRLDSLDAEVCLIPPDLANLPDIIVADVGVEIADAQFTLGYSLNAGTLLWNVRAIGIEKDPINGQFIGPALTLASTIGRIEDQYNVALHEFGHSFGQGHVEVPSPITDDVMYAQYHYPEFPARRCLSTLNLQVVWEGYKWLGGAFQTPPLFANVLVSDYDQRYC